MNPVDFVALHTPDGTFIAKMVSDDGDTITADVGTVFGNKIFYGIPKDIVTLHYEVPVCSGSNVSERTLAGGDARIIPGSSKGGMSCMN